MTSQDPQANPATPATPSGDGAVRVLLVEDNPLDVRATLRAAQKLKINNQIDVVTDGQAAIDYLTSAQREKALPDLILLDLNLPGVDGHDVLRMVKSNEALQRIPVVVLTTSEDEADVHGAYDVGANAYVMKPIGLDGWQHVVSQIEGFWLTLVKLPSR